MLGTGAWDVSGGGTITGLEDVDLWVGGLAEATNVNGGLLGSTFNYVFERQLTDLQDGDRLYYLNRTAGMNLLSQLEGNSFAEMIQRNTQGTRALKGDAFATADCRFELGHLDGNPQGFATDGSTVHDDPTSECDESKLLLRAPDGTIAYRATNTVDPSGVNGQSVYDGTPGVDRVTGGSDSDTFWGGAGPDVIEGNGGDDVAVGGDGADIVTDASGADTLRGGPGSDALDAGPGNDLVLGGDGADFTNGGGNDNQTFAGPGDDYVIAGGGGDVAQGDGGDDWIEGGAGRDTLVGDHGAPYFDDPGQVAPGNDVFVGQTGDNGYDAEGGDDILIADAGIERNAGAGGYDWSTHERDTVKAGSDLNLSLIGVPLPAGVFRDRYQEVEGLSGGPLDDILRGDDVVPRTVGGAGFTGNDFITADSLTRIAGLAALLPDFSAAPATPPTAPAGVWGEGNISPGRAGLRPHRGPRCRPRHRR